MILLQSDYGEFKCYQKEDIDKFVFATSKYQFDDIWVSGKTDYPALAILRNKNKICIHYFEAEGGSMYQSFSNSVDKNMVAFKVNGEESFLPSNTIITLEEAILCIEQFLSSKTRPTCITWQDL